MKPFVLALLLALPLISNAELYQMEIQSKGDPEAPFKSTVEGVTVTLIEDASENLINALVTVPAEAGPIETAILVITNPSGEKVGRIILGAQALEKGSQDYEFSLAENLLKNSMVLVSHREKDDLHAAKILLGTFPVRRTPNLPAK